jgi:hypothetical protein
MSRHARIKQMSLPMNPFLELVRTGRITTLVQLRSAYRTLLLKSHPDAVGSDRLLERYLSFSSYYEEARLAIQQAEGSPSENPDSGAENHRLAFYQALQKLERIDKPYAFHRKESITKINDLKMQARYHFNRWGGMDPRIYMEADRDYDRLKAEKPSGPYMKNALAINVIPIVHNIVAYHLTGIDFYKKQVKQNLQAVMGKLDDHCCATLRTFIELLLDDMKDGPAVFMNSGSPSRKKLQSR